MNLPADNKYKLRIKYEKNNYLKTLKREQKQRYTRKESILERREQHGISFPVLCKKKKKIKLWLKDRVRCARCAMPKTTT